MTKVRLHIEHLKVRNAVPGDAAALAEGLRGALSAQLAHNPSALTPGVIETLRLQAPPSAGQPPMTRGRVIGSEIAKVLARSGKRRVR